MGWVFDETVVGVMRGEDVWREDRDILEGLSCPFLGVYNSWGVGGSFFKDRAFAEGVGSIDWLRRFFIEF